MTHLHSTIVCRKCRVPFEFHSTQIVGAPNNVRHIIDYFRFHSTAATLQAAHALQSAVEPPFGRCPLSGLIQTCLPDFSSQISDHKVTSHRILQTTLASAGLMTQRRPAPPSGGLLFAAKMDLPPSRCLLRRPA